MIFRITWWFVATVPITSLLLAGLSCLANHRSGDRRELLEAKGRYDLQALVDCIRMFRWRESRLPELEELTSSIAHGERLLDRLPLDPWGREYRLMKNGDGSTVIVSSAGADGTFDTADDLRRHHP